MLYSYNSSHEISKLCPEPDVRIVEMSRHDSLCSITLLGYNYFDEKNQASLWQWNYNKSMNTSYWLIVSACFQGQNYRYSNVYVFIWY